LEFIKGEIYNGFKLIHNEFIDEIKSNALIFEHVKTKARLIKFENDDNNKVFSITFKTPPVDNTGLPHILEHSVLCGSKKFKVKEPFVELLKGSVNTFLNAFTFPDKTMYPVASMNTKDFFNLIDVYLDAVFYPEIYNNKLILMQEGCHLELDDIDKPLSYKGVVYNEMKGALSSVNQIIFKNIQSGLFPDTIYAFESGGDPDYIPDLTEKKFLAYHKKFYHPSNSYIYLFGDGNTMDELDFIDNKYLKDFDEIKVDSKIKCQKAFDKPIKIKKFYPISANDPVEDKEIFTINFGLNKATDKELVLAFTILEHILFDTPASPLKNALLDAGIGEDIFGTYESEILNTYFSIVAKNCSKDKQALFKQTVFKTLKDLAKNSIDKKLIEASINHIEFIYREADGEYSQGLSNNILILTSWLYDEDPLMHLKYEEVISSIRERSKNGYFEELIKKYFIDNRHVAYINLSPDKNLLLKRERAVEKKLSDIKKSLTQKQLNEIIDNTKILKDYQSQPDNYENLMTIPRLSLEDIKKKADFFPTIVYNEGNLKVLHHPLDTNKIIYLSLLFNTKGVSQDKIQYVNLLQELLSELTTKNFDYKDLSNEINIHTGGIDFDNHLFRSKDTAEEYFPYFIVNGKALLEKTNELIKLIVEIINNTVYDNKKRIKELLLELKSILKDKIDSNSINLMHKRIFSYFSQSGMYEEQSSGITYIEFLIDIINNFDKRYEEVINNLVETAKIIFNKNNLLISVTCSSEDYDCFKEHLKIIDENIFSSPVKYNEYKFKLKKLNEGIITNNRVMSVGMGFNLKKIYPSFTRGHMQVLRTIIDLDYLWNRVRVQGGAYGAGTSIERNGRVLIYSYRDPNIENTLNAFFSIYKYIEELNLNDDEIVKYIIGTIKNYDKYIPQKEKGQIACANYIIGITQEMYQKERYDILSTKLDDIKFFKSIFEKALKDYSICVFGNGTRIKQAKKLFGTLKKNF
jgi:Zn-dependent M16 (insulinase) family peptidase